MCIRDRDSLDFEGTLRLEVRDRAGNVAVVESEIKEAVVRPAAASKRTKSKAVAGRRKKATKTTGKAKKSSKKRAKR